MSLANPPSSTTSPTPAQNVQRLRENAATTPGRLTVFLGALFVAAFLLWLIAFFSIAATHDLVKTIGQDSVPSIVAAQQIRANLADMNASAANAFLCTGEQLKAVLAQYEQDRQNANAGLVKAAENITYGEDERGPIKTMVSGMQDYAGLVAVARSKGGPEGLPALREASQQMHQTLLPAADALDKANFKHLDAAYSSVGATSLKIQAFLFLAELLLGLLLVATQFFLFRRMRRIINLPLAGATVLLVVFALVMHASIHSENALLKTAKEDSFDSIDALSNARSIAYDANADESLYLLDPPRAQQFEQQFRQKSAQLADVKIDDALIASLANSKPNFKGLLGNELRNITFPGEQEAATETLKDYGQYMAIDGQIRSLEQSGRHQEAVALCIGTQEGQSNYAFDQFDKALGKTLQINQDEFDKATNSAFARLNWLPYFAPIVAVLIALLAWFGLQARIQEYRA